MTRPHNKNPPDCAIEMHIKHQTKRRTVLMPIGVAARVPFEVYVRPRHCEHHATARFCFRTANWLKATRRTS